MSRRNPEPASENLQYVDKLGRLITGYQADKGAEKSLKERIDNASGEIKTIMREHNLEEFVVGSIKATITVKENESFNELQAIEILREKLTSEQFSSVVKTREYIDDDAFEALTYTGKVNADILQPAVSPAPPTVTLRLGKVK